MRKTTPEEIQNKAFGHLIAKNEIKKKNKIYWECICICGKTVLRDQWYLLSSKFTHSCGCKHGMLDKIGQRAYQWTGHEEITGEYLAQLKHAAKSRGLEWSVTPKFLWELFLSQNRKCALTGLELNFTPSYKKSRKVDQTASLDRIDAAKPYTEDNLQWIHKKVNHMKNKYSQDEFIEICRLVTIKSQAYPPT